MSITVERRYRVTTNGTESDMSEDEARTLAFGLLSALGFAPATVEPIETVAASVEPPAQLPSGPVAAVEAQEPVASVPPVPRMTSKKPEYAVRAWHEDEAELRGLHAEGLSNKEIAARLDRSTGAVSVQLAKLGLRRGAKAAPAPEMQQVVNISPPLPTVTPGQAAAVQGAVGWTPDGKWTHEQTKALIRAMSPGQGGIREAADATGHSMGGCGLRWKHLKSAGLMTMEKYLSSPEAVPA